MLHNTKNLTILIGHKLNIKLNTKVTAISPTKLVEMLLHQLYSPVHCTQINKFLLLQTLKCCSQIKCWIFVYMAMMAVTTFRYCSSRNSLTLLYNYAYVSTKCDTVAGKPVPVTSNYDSDSNSHFRSVSESLLLSLSSVSSASRNRCCLFGLLHTGPTSSASDASESASLGGNMSPGMLSCVLLHAVAVSQNCSGLQIKIANFCQSNILFYIFIITPKQQTVDKIIQYNTAQHNHHKSRKELI